MIEVRLYKRPGDAGELAGAAWTWSAAQALGEAALRGLAARGEAVDAWTEIAAQGAQEGARP